MKRTILIFSVVVAVLLVVGYMVFRALVAAPTSKSSGSHQGGPTDSMGPLAMVPRGGDAGITRPTPGAPVGSGLVVQALDGTVEYRGPDQKWRVVGRHTKLSINDTIKTSVGSGVTLIFDGGSTVRVDSRSELAVRHASQGRIGIQLQRGRAAVNHQPKQQMVFRIESSQTGSAVETQGAKFAVLSTSKRLAVATTRGQVKLKTKKGTVTVREGQQSSVGAGEAPRAPMRIPMSVLLKLAKPRQRIIRVRYVWLSGQVVVGTELRINDQPVQTDSRGQFRTRVTLRVGRNRLVAEARDVSGRSKRLDLGVLIVRPKARVTDVMVRWD